jgi:hypothetical protein
MVRWFAGGAWLGAGRSRTATGRTTAMAGASARPRGRHHGRGRASRGGANRGARNKRPEHARTAATIGLRSRLARGPKHLRSNELEHLVALGLRGGDAAFERLRLLLELGAQASGGMAERDRGRFGQRDERPCRLMSPMPSRSQVGGRSLLFRSAVSLTPFADRSRVQDGSRYRCTHALNRCQSVR